jgi:hypothetical protein
LAFAKLGDGSVGSFVFVLLGCGIEIEIEKDQRQFTKVAIYFIKRSYISRSKLKCATRMYNI